MAKLGWAGAWMLLTLLAASCSASTPEPEFTEPAWTHLKHITLDVAAIEIIDSTEPIQAPPHVEHLFPVMPAKAVERWARDRLRAGGLANRARFIVREASVVEAKQPPPSWLTTIFTWYQSERYDAVLDALLEVRDDKGRLVGQVETVVRKSRTVRLGASLKEHQQEWMAMTNELMQIFNAEMEENIPKYLGPWVMQ